MDASLEQKILEAFSDSLKLPESIQEARQDWITTTQQIAQVIVLASDEPPVSTDRLYGMASRAEQKNQVRQLTDYAKQAFVKTIKKKHDAVLEKNGGPEGLKSLSELPKGIMTRDDMYGRYTHSNLPIPKQMATRWQIEVTEVSKKVTTLLGLVDTQLQGKLKQHKENCIEYKRGGCIQGYTVDEKSTEIVYDPGNHTDKIGVMDQSIYDLQTVINNTETGRSGLRICSSADMTLLKEALKIIERMSELIGDRFALIWAAQSKVLTDEDFEDIKNDHRMSRVMLKQWGINIQKPLVAVRDANTTNQVVQRIIEEYENVSRYGDKSYDSIDDYIEELTKNTEAYEQLYIDIEAYIPYEENLKEDYELIISRWDEYYEAFQNDLDLSKQKVDQKDMSVGGININYAIPGPTARHELSDVPRAVGDNRPTLVDIYNDIQTGKRKAGEFSWVVIFGTAESALKGSKDGECSVCSGTGIITAKNISITVAGDKDPGYWNDFHQIQDGEEGTNLESHKCSHCEGTGKVHPNMWLTLPSDFTPYELVVKSVWDTLQLHGLKPVAYDGFIPDEDQPDNADFPIPAPARPQVQSHYDMPITGESNVMGYTTIIKLENPMGADTHQGSGALHGERVSNRTSVQSYFVNNIYKPLGELLKSYQMAYGLEDSDRGVKETENRSPREPKKELRIWGFQKQPRYKFHRERPDLKRKDGEEENYFIAKDVSDFDEQVLGIEASDEYRDWTPSQTFLSELVKFKAIANDLENVGQKDLALMAYSFMGIESILRGQKLLISNYDKIVNAGKKDSYSRVIEAILVYVKKRSDNLKGSERLEGPLQRLLEKAYRFDFEQTKDIGIELKLYLRTTEELKRMQMRSLFNPGVREIKANLNVYSTEDIYAIASRVDKVFKSLGPGNHSDNPTPYILIPIGGEISARYYSDVDDMQILQELAPAFQKVGQLELLKKLYWRSQADGQRLLDVLRQEASNPEKSIEPAVSKLRETYPQYGHVDKIVNQFQEDNSADPRAAFVAFFLKGYNMVDKLYESIPKEKLDEFYEKIRRKDSKATSESDLKKLEAFSKASENRLYGSAKRKRVRRLAQQEEDLKGIIEDVDRQTQENDTWMKKYQQYKAKIDSFSFGGLGRRAGADPKIVLELELADNIIRMMSDGVKYSDKIKSVWHLESIVQSLSQVAPYFEKWFQEEGLRGFSLGGLFEPGTDNDDSAIEKAIELTGTVLTNVFKRTENDSGYIEVKSPDGVRGFFEKLLM